MAVAEETLWLALAFLVIAALYAAVGQAGASGYLAAMGLGGLAPEVMKPTALALNLVVAAIGTVLVRRAGLLDGRTFWPFAVLGFPFSLLGGALQLPAQVYYPAVGAVLVLSGALILRSARRVRRAAPAVPPVWPALVTGAVIGFVSGTTGTGGGVFLAPVILGMNWVEPRRAAAVTAAYNLLNSGAALAGAWASLGNLPPALPLWGLAAGVGGVIGAVLGSRYLPATALRRLLALVLLLSGARLLLS